jgi:hypothetical protein
MLFREIITVYSKTEIDSEGKMQRLLMLKQVVHIVNSMACQTDSVKKMNIVIHDELDTIQ